MKDWIPSMPIKLAFIPEDAELLKPILEVPTAWRFWLLWKAGHIVCQHFNEQAIEIGKIIDRRQPKTALDLEHCFWDLKNRSGLSSHDVDRFCQWAIDYFNGSKEVEVVIVDMTR